jgi:hypothetical protein
VLSIFSPIRASSLCAVMMNDTRGAIVRFLTGRFLKSEIIASAIGYPR